MSHTPDNSAENLNDTTQVPVKILDRLKKMLALANNAGATEGERDTALSMVHNIMAKYNLDMAEIEAHHSKGKVDDNVVIDSEVFYGRPWAISIAHSVATLMFCTYFSTRSTVKNMAGHNFVGTSANVMAAKMMAKFLIEGTLFEARRQSRELGEGSAWRRSFGMGASHKIYHRCAALKAETAQAPVPGTALVLTDVYKAAEARNELAIRSFGVELRSAPSRAKKTANTEAYTRGAAHGSKVNLGQNIKG